MKRGFTECFRPERAPSVSVGQRPTKRCVNDIALKGRHPKRSIALVLCVLAIAPCFGETTNHLEKWKESQKAKPVATATNAVSVGVWTQDFDAAKELAKEKGLPMFLNFTGSDWCGWCKLMDSQVFSKTEWKNYAKTNLVLVTIDFPQNKSLVPSKYVSRNQSLQTQYKVRGYPTYIIINPHDQKVLGQLGASRDATPQQFIRDVKKITDNHKIEAASDKEQQPKVKIEL